MKFGRTYTNKLVSFADRYFTYDRKEMKRENTSTYFDFYALNNDSDTTIAINRDVCGIYVYIRKGGELIISKILKTYSEVEDFKCVVRCLG